MQQIILRIRPLEIMDDLQLDLIRERIKRLSAWEVELQDTRLYDAPYVSVIVKISAITEEVVSRLKATFADLPRMRVLLWQSVGVEIPLKEIDIAILKKGLQQAG